MTGNRDNPKQKDTSAWILQTWLSFAIAMLVAIYGLFNLPIDLWQKGYLTMGLFFCLCSTFALAKTIRDNHHRRVDTGAWVMQSWAAFIASALLTATGIWHLKVEFWVQGYAAVAMLFVVTTAFTLAKTLRDNNPNEVLDQAHADVSIQASPAAGPAQSAEVAKKPNPLREDIKSIVAKFDAGQPA
jgi:hypothetical protein